MNTDTNQPTEANPEYLSPDLSSDEVRKARGLEPEQPKPVTPESLARDYAATHIRTWRDSAFLGFLAGYRASAERNADLAQARDLAEEALKRHGFERGVVNDVVTWVSNKSMETCEVCRWTNNGCLKVQGRWTCHGCIDRGFAEIASLEEERDKLRELTAWKIPAAEAYTAIQAERDTLRAELSTAREEERSAVDSWHNMCEERDAANEAREKAERHRKALSQYLRAGSLDVDAYLGVYDERGALKAALEKARAEAERLKQHLSNQCDGANRWEDAAEQAEKKCDDLRRQLWEAKEEIKALKMREGLEKIAEHAPTRASETRQRYIGETEAWAGEDARGGQPREELTAPRQVPQTCDYMSPAYGCCQLPLGHEGCHIHKLSKP